MKIVLGTDVGAINFPWTDVNQAVELQYQVRFGMSPIEALRTATVSAADLLGVGERIGRIEAGAFADLIAVKGDPLADVSALSNVDFVMQGGAVVRAVG